MKNAFDQIDTDGSGEIEFEELKTAFLSMKNDDLLHERLKELDFNGDKTIAFSEFIYGFSAWVGMDNDFNDEESYDHETFAQYKNANEKIILHPSHTHSM